MIGELKLVSLSLWCPSLTALGAQITGWVAEAILVQEDLKKRSAWIKQFVAIADVSVRKRETGRAFAIIESARC